MARVHASLRLFATLWLLSLVASCVTYARIDTRPIKQQLADRPLPKFSAENIDAFNSADRTRPFRLNFKMISAGCTPLAPPAREMNHQKVNRVDGTISAIVLPSGLFDSVRAVNVVPESLTADVEAMFTLALITPPCRLPPLASSLTVEIPFILRLD